MSKAVLIAAAMITALLVLSGRLLFALLLRSSGAKDFGGW